MKFCTRNPSINVCYMPKSSHTNWLRYHSFVRLQTMALVIMQSSVFFCYLFPRRSSNAPQNPGSSDKHYEQTRQAMYVCSNTKGHSCNHRCSGKPVLCIPIMGHAVAQLVEALRYKPGRGFDSRWCHWNFSLTQSFRPHYGPGVDSASNRNEYQEYFLGVKGAGA